MENKQNFEYEQNNQLPPVNELAAVLLADKYEEDKVFARLLDNDAQQALGETFAMQMPAGLRVKTVTNTKDMVHVPLPNHSKMAELAAQQSRRPLLDEEMKRISGGEIFFLTLFSVGATFMGTVGAAIATGVVAGGATLAVGGAIAGVSAAAAKGKI